ncbi:MAG: S9 family peptidase [Bacteroidia bacterium]
MKKLVTRLFIIAFFVSNLNAQDKISLADIWVNYAFVAQGTQGFNTMNDGLHYTDIEEDKENGMQLSKFQIKNGKKVEVLLKANDVKVDGKALDISNYSFSPGEDKLLFSKNVEFIYRRSWKADYFVYDLKAKSLINISDNGKIMFPTFSPDGRKLAYVRDNNLYIRNLTTNIETAITKDGEDNKIKNGWGDWVYEEEFSKADYFCWSPNSQYLAFIRFDERKVKEFDMDFYKGELYPEKYKFKYPKAGEDNSIVTCHVVDVNAFPSKSIVNVDIGKETDIYLPRLMFTNDNNILSLQRLNRLQNKFELLFVESNTGKSKVVYTDEAKTYIDITDDLTFVANKGFIISSEKDEYNHLYYYDLSGKLISQLTKGKWDVISFDGFDERSGTLYYTSTENGAINRDVYSVSLNGSNKRRISEKSGFNQAIFMAGYKYYIFSHSEANVPSVYELRDMKGKVVKVLEDNQELRNKLKNYNMATKEFMTVKNSSGIELNGWMMKPSNFDENKKYPVYMYAYNGPGANECNNNWESFEFMWHQLLCQEGYIVVCVDGRGTLGRGREFKHSTYLQLGKYETEDQIDVAKYLGTLPFVDKDRIGFQGWSYGGFMACNLITKGADYFKATIAVAPVTNWKYYDNIYTERFMRKPSENKEGYEDNSPVNHVKKVKGKFLLIHGSADDNVHLQNTMEFAKALVANNKEFDMMIYPNKNHGIAGGFTRYHIFNKMLQFVKTNL